MQLNQAHYLAVAYDLGISFRGRPTTWEIYKAIRDELDRIHGSLAVLYPRTRMGVDVLAKQSRLRALHDDARRRSEHPDDALDLVAIRELLVSLGDYTGNVDKRSGIDRCAQVLAVTHAIESVKAKP